MKKLFDFIKDYFKHIVFVVLTSSTLSFFGWVGYSIKSSFEKYTSVPAKMDKMMEIHKQDSVNAVEYMKNDDERETHFIQQLEELKKEIKEMKSLKTQVSNPKSNKVTAIPIKPITTLIHKK